ncbi:hypothetical protein [Mastigocoleus testarum]|uniref:Uncharacterized protein n=1 Tax=Mastigocoleus testarum BC008 TaxID=371196 RepID=A0A0V7ZI63_9CYAN|nr:hypothetical protein [Mastigocoleus testarum]KST64071.1 hypothetical protein BC008_40470 [Mastigocoleus testarum BC008]KST64781.1 hypothetical protein BC008_41445 [Mastigocoleus testarum BC008]
MPERIHWTETIGNKYVTSLHPSMLTPKGYIKKCTTPMIGSLKQRVPVEVTYDRAYVKLKIRKAVIQGLTPITKDELLKLISECWDEEYAERE